MGSEVTFVLNGHGLKTDLNNFWIAANILLSFEGEKEMF